MSEFSPIKPGQERECPAPIAPPHSSASPGAEQSADTAAPAPEAVTLVKGEHRWSFWCEAGGEPALLRRISELAGAVDAPFDWFDAALVSHQLSRRLRPGLNRIQNEKPTRPAASATAAAPEPGPAATRQRKPGGGTSRSE